MKGQFFISSVVVIAVILIVSMTYANSAEELRIESTSDLEFDNYRNAYKDAVPDDWEFINYVNRTKIGICVSDSTDTSISNTSVQFTSGSGEPATCSELNTSSEIMINVTSISTPCWLLVKPSTLPNYNSLNCTEFYVYHGVALSITTVVDPPYASINGTKFDAESITISPHDHVVSDYREKNILVNETSSTNKVYNVSYQSDRIDYTGQL